MPDRSQTLKRVLISYALSLAVWLAFAVLMAYQSRVVATAYGKTLPWRIALLLPTVRYLCFALLTPPIFFIAKRFPVDSHHKWKRTSFYVMGMAPFIVCFAVLRWLILPPFDIPTERFISRSFEGFLGIIAGTFSDQISMYFAIVGLAHAYSFFARTHQQEVEKSELQQALTASELSLLKLQLHPHFIFNTLHGISTLMDSDRELAKRMILELSSLLRVALEHSSADLIPLASEIKFVDSYLHLQKMRFGTRMQVRTCFDSATLTMLVPQMIFQPIVENAISHGVACCREGGWIEVGSRESNGALELRVKNSIGTNSAPGTGVGIPNTRARLRHLYGDEAYFHLTRNDSFAETMIRVPIFQTFGSPAKSPELSSAGVASKE